VPSAEKKTPHPTDVHVGNRVRMRRLMLGMSQEKLGEALGVTFQQVQKYEKGTNRVSASRLQQISHILQVPVPFFFEGAPGVAAAPEGETSSGGFPQVVTEFLASKRGVEFAQNFGDLPPDVASSIVDLVKTVAEEARKRKK